MKKFIQFALVFFAIYTSNYVICAQQSIKTNKEINDALMIAIKMNQTEEVEQYLSMDFALNSKVIEIGLYNALTYDRTILVKLLLPLYEGDFYFCTQKLYNCSMLEQTLAFCNNSDDRYFKKTDFEAKINNIIQLIEAGASPFKIHGNRMSFWARWITFAEPYPELQDPRIAQAIKNFHAQEMERIQKQAHAIQEIHATLCEPNAFNGIGDLADIVNEYIFGEYTLEEDEPKAIHFHDEK